MASFSYIILFISFPLATLLREKYLVEVGTNFRPSSFFKIESSPSLFTEARYIFLADIEFNEFKAKLVGVLFFDVLIVC